MIWIWAGTLAIFVTLWAYLLRMQMKRAEEHRRAVERDQ